MIFFIIGVCKITILPPLFVCPPTKETKINMGQSLSSPNVLLAPLDWGLGHATRCVPVVRELLRQGCNVLLAGEGKQQALFQQEFPDLRFLPLPGYRIEYASSGWGLAVKIVAQIPKLLSAIKAEQEWLQKVAADEKIDAVIADNRYGLFHPAIPCAFITHQLRIKAPFSLAEDLLQEINYSYINKFSECWVPDAQENGLAGALSHPEELPEIPLRYIGPLSRFTEREPVAPGNNLLFLLSGPEPQRTLLEEMILEELKSYAGTVVLVRGLPNEKNQLQVAGNVTSYPHLPAQELEQKICEADLVISRCGYSTVMDLAVLKKRSVLIPTPGQTEQEYLGEYLMKRNFALCIDQKKFTLKNAVAMAANFPYTFPAAESSGLLAEAVSSFLQRLSLVNKNEA